ncbi:Sulfotransferase [Trinorchestia longiramus]|nr:Sulfotransferase [Trinorchestia longiramus]
MTKISTVIARTTAIASCALLIFYTINHLVASREWRTSVSFWHEQDSFDWNHPSNDTGTKKDVLFFNRIPKTGSEMFVLLLTWLQALNDFSHVRLRSDVRHLSHEQQVSLVSKMKSRMGATPSARVSFDQHLHFLDFSKVGLPAVTYFTVVREPIEKLTSRFYYARATPRPGGFTPPGGSDAPRDVPPYSTIEECIAAQHPDCTFLPGHSYDLTITYFCGHAPYCRELGNEGAYVTAQRNLADHFSTVGVLEELNLTLAVLERKLPKFFTGVTELYYQQLGGMELYYQQLGGMELYYQQLVAPHRNKNYQRPPSISASAEAALKANLTFELKFYDLVRARLLKQATELGIQP